MPDDKQQSGATPVDNRSRERKWTYLTIAAHSPGMSEADLNDEMQINPNAVTTLANRTVVTFGVPMLFGDIGNVTIGSFIELLENTHW